MIVLLTKVRVPVASSTPEVSRYPEVPKYPPAKRSVRFNSSGTVSVDTAVLKGEKRNKKRFITNMVKML
jgi:hypothetical protein